MLIQGREEILSARDESYGNTPLHIACGMHSYDCAKILIEAGSDLSIQNFLELTPLGVVEAELTKF